jgi:signal transduction histidine kinase
VDKGLSLRASGKEPDAAGSQSWPPSSAWLEALHDLRQPLQAAQLLLDVMAACDDAAERQRTARLIEGSIAGIECMLEELAELSRLEAGEKKLELVPVELGAVLAAVAVEPAIGLVEDRARHLGRELGEVRVLGEARLVATMLRGLLASAKAPAPTAVRKGAELSLAVDVPDAPMPAKSRPAMFIEPSRAARERGAPAVVPGPGLARRLAALCGGRLDCLALAGGGVSLVLTLRLAPPR